MQPTVQHRCDLVEDLGETEVSGDFLDEIDRRLDELDRGNEWPALDEELDDDGETPVGRESRWPLPQDNEGLASTPMADRTVGSGDDRHGQERDREDRVEETTDEAPRQPDVDPWASSRLRLHRRGTPASRCSHDHDPAGELPPCVTPPGYVRGADGCWRYVWGGIVPGATDDRLDRRYLYGRRPGSFVHVPEERTSRPDLEWVSAHAVDTGWARGRDGLVRTMILSRQCWDDHARVPLGVLAPELLAQRVLDLRAFADRCSLRPATVNSYRSRGLLPEPQMVIAGTPLWSEPVVGHWLDEREASSGRLDGVSRKS